MRRILLSFALIAATSAITHNANENSEYKKYFDQIDDFLVKRVDQDDAVINLEAAKDWLKTEEQIDPTSKIVEALKLFISLERARKESTCDAQIIEILMKNDEATDGHTLDPHKDLEKLRRIERIIDFYASEHADSCFDPVSESGNPASVNYDPTIPAIYPPIDQPNWPMEPTQKTNQVLKPSRIYPPTKDEPPVFVPPSIYSVDPEKQNNNWPQPDPHKPAVNPFTNEPIQYSHQQNNQHNYQPDMQPSYQPNLVGVIAENADKPLHPNPIPSKPGVSERIKLFFDKMMKNHKIKKAARAKRHQEEAIAKAEIKKKKKALKIEKERQKLYNRPHHHHHYHGGGGGNNGGGGSSFLADLLLFDALTDFGGGGGGGDCGGGGGDFGGGGGDFGGGGGDY